VGFSPIKTNREKDPCWAKNSEKNLEKILRTIYRDQGLHYIGSQIIVELVDMQESFIWLPTIA
jgi:adenine specific DNA methylase Mod